MNADTDTETNEYDTTNLTYGKEVVALRVELVYGTNKLADDTVVIDTADEIIRIQDLNAPFPLDDDSIDFVMASHCLQYVEDLQAVMKEIYRVCKHRAIVCIVAPYAHVTSHMVHPLYRQQFNEHLPRYWTDYPLYSLDPDEYLLSWQKHWPLMDMPSKQTSLDLRLLRLEFFYFPQYGNLYETTELMLLRQSQLNVAYQIMYHLLVVKQPISDGEVARFATEPMDEPDYVQQQRLGNDNTETDVKLFEPQPLRTSPTNTPTRLSSAKQKKRKRTPTRMVQSSKRPRKKRTH
ncbi:MAG: methyltransferase domain-containing protein [Candidatus Pristimantibacillus sp.]